MTRGQTHIDPPRPSRGEFARGRWCWILDCGPAEVLVYHLVLDVSFEPGEGALRQFGCGPMWSVEHVEAKAVSVRTNGHCETWPLSPRDQLRVERMFRSVLADDADLEREAVGEVLR